MTEGILEMLDRPKPLISGWKTSWPYEQEKHQLGFRGQTIEYSADDYVILLLGDSQVECRACAFEWMPERRLELHLSSLGKKVKVFSLGGWGTGTDQQLLSLKEYYQQFRADLVLLWFTPANDVWNNFFPTNMPDDVTPKPTFWLKAEEILGPTELTGQPARETPLLKLMLLWRKIFPWPREKDWAQFLPAPYTPMEEYGSVAEHDWQRKLERNPDLQWENFGTDKHDKILWLTPRSPRTKYGLDLTRKLILATKTLAASHGARFAMFWVRPDNSVRNHHKERAETVHVLNGKYYKTSLIRFDENMDYICRGFTTFIISPPGGAWRVGPQDEHLNEHATDHIIKELTAELVSFIQTDTKPSHPPSRGSAVP